MISGLERSLILAEKKVRRQTQWEIAEKLLTKGMSAEEVADTTGLSLEKIRKLEGKM